MSETEFKNAIVADMHMSDAINELASALAKAQGSMEGAKKSAENPFFKSSYADIASVWHTIRKPLSDNGLAVIQTTRQDSDDFPVVITTLIHNSGQWISGELKIKPDKQTPQAIGSALTYARRYALMGIVGIAPEDDDAESATDRNKKDIKKGKQEKKEKKTAQQYIDELTQIDNFVHLKNWWGKYEKEMKSNLNKKEYEEINNLKDSMKSALTSSPEEIPEEVTTTEIF